MGFEDDRQDHSKYAGFRVRWDKDLNTFVFDSQSERDRWQIQHYGKVRNFFREPDEPIDERPCLLYREPFWKDADERKRYERAVEAAPPSQYGSLPADRYLSEIVKLAEGIKPSAPAVKSMPDARPWEDR